MTAPWGSSPMASRRLPAPPPGRGHPWQPGEAPATGRPRGPAGAESARTWRAGRAVDRAEGSSRPWAGPAASGSAGRAGSCPAGVGRLGAGRPARSPRPGCSGGSSGALWLGRSPAARRSRSAANDGATANHDQAGANAVGAVQRTEHVAGTAGRAGAVSEHAGGRILSAASSGRLVWKLQRPTRLLRALPPTPPALRARPPVIP
jgi:hypothetical protein